MQDDYRIEVACSCIPEVSIRNTIELGSSISCVKRERGLWTRRVGPSCFGQIDEQRSDDDETKECMKDQQHGSM